MFSLAALATFLDTVVAPQAMGADQDPAQLRQLFEALGQRHWLALQLSRDWGGQALDELTFRKFQEQVARYSGALAFLQTQHQSAARMLAASDNTALQQQYLPHLAAGQVRIGIGFSQLRRPAPPMLQATPCPGGYQLEGEIPWITGWNCFEQVIVAATLPDGAAVFGMVPFQAQTQADTGGTIRLSPPMALVAMASTNTVSAHLERWVLPQAQVVDVKPPDWIHANDRRNALKHGFFALGCAQAGLDLIAAAQSRLPAFVAESLRSLTAELSQCRQAVYVAQTDPTSTATEQLPLRAWSIDLAGRCAQAAVAVSRGAANVQTHPAQRIYREALAFTIFGQTTAVMAATLAQLTRPIPSRSPCHSSETDRG